MSRGSKPAFCGNLRDLRAFKFARGQADKGVMKTALPYLKQAFFATAVFYGTALSFMVLLFLFPSLSLLILKAGIHIEIGEIELLSFIAVWLFFYHYDKRKTSKEDNEDLKSAVILAKAGVIRREIKKNPKMYMYFKNKHQKSLLNKIRKKKVA